mgnify:CR=1 FL=1
MKEQDEVEKIDSQGSQDLSDHGEPESVIGSSQLTSKLPNINAQQIKLQLSKHSKLLKNLPNYLTFIRLGLIPIFVSLMIDPSPTMVMAAVFIFILAAITDLLDGIIARNFSAVSDLGKLLDPLVDKVLVMAALVMLVAQRSDIDGAPWVPGWLVVLVLAREIWVTGIRGVAAANGVIVAAQATGKLKSLLQMVAIVLLLLHHQTLFLFGFHTSCQFLGLNLLFLSILLSYWSAFEYTHQILILSSSEK